LVNLRFGGLELFFDRMGLNVHDLLRLRDSANLVSRDQVPEWANQALSDAPWVVVRRAPFEGEFIPVGVRGQNRGERFGAYLHTSSIVECVRPEALSVSQAWEKIGHRKELPARRALLHVHAALQTSELSWGPVGSVGFELASGFPAAHGTSDLDLIFRVSDFNIRPATTSRLLTIVQESSVRVEILLESREGAISFLEFANDEPTLVLRTVNGPVLRGNVSAYRRVGMSACGRDVSACGRVGGNVSACGRVGVSAPVAVAKTILLSSADGATSSRQADTLLPFADTPTRPPADTFPQ
jgi:phosphoribosyl-dephospho-CoA transferase